MHQIKQLADPALPISASPPKVAPPTPISTVNHGAGPSTSNGVVASISNSGHSATVELRRLSQHQDLLLSMDEARSNSPHLDILKRKRTSKRGSATSRKTRQEHLDLQDQLQDLFSKATSSLGSGSSSRSRLYGSSGKTSSFLASLNPARWGRADRHVHKVLCSVHHIVTKMCLILLICFV